MSGDPAPWTARSASSTGPFSAADELHGPVLGKARDQALVLATGDRSMTW